MESIAIFRVQFAKWSDCSLGYPLGSLRIALEQMVCCVCRIVLSVAGCKSIVGWGALSVWATANACAAAEAVEYNRDIRPVLAEHCFACHGADSAARKADLRLDQRQAAIDAGAIEPGQPDNSELIARIVSTDADLLMPPSSDRHQ